MNKVKVCSDSGWEKMGGQNAIVNEKKNCLVPVIMRYRTLFHGIFFFCSSCHCKGVNLFSFYKVIKNERVFCVLSCRKMPFLFHVVIT